MDDTESLRHGDLAAEDIAAALALSTGVGWNQTAADWALFIAHGRVIGLWEQLGRLVATAAALPYDQGFGWISMVIVAPEWRRRGLARRLMVECIETLRRQGRAALLDATPAGAEVYAKLGFVSLCGMERWQGDGGAAATGDGVKPLPPHATLDLTVADEVAFGANRGFLLRDFLARDGSMVLHAGEAMAVMRRGERATQLGPLIAPSAESARRLLAGALARAHGPVFLDLLESGKDLAPLLEANGFRIQRPFRRMALGRGTLPGNPARLICAAGPEFG
ncbi:MAG TPA: GNAT family N-acetyltransferase [Stellaceae bacterium]|nr:GNAT family N-acetyltransferase [Stellaceae bacterium]